MSDKLVTMKQFNGTDFDEILPKTVAQQIPDLIATIETLGYSKIEMGRYLGTGVYRSQNKNFLTFNFTPKLILIGKESNFVMESTRIILFKLSGTFLTYQGGESLSYQKYNTYEFDQTTQTFYWYSTDNAPSQLNQEFNMGGTYYYIGIG